MHRINKEWIPVMLALLVSTPILLVKLNARPALKANFLVSRTPPFVPAVLPVALLVISPPMSVSLPVLIAYPVSSLRAPVPFCAMLALLVASPLNPVALFVIVVNLVNTKIKAVNKAARTVLLVLSPLR
jgi:hypothetical protein